MVVAILGQDSPRFCDFVLSFQTCPLLMQSNLDSDGDSSVESSTYAFVRQDRRVTSGMQRDRACIRDYCLCFSCSCLLCQPVFN